MDNHKSERGGFTPRDGISPSTLPTFESSLFSWMICVDSHDLFVSVFMVNLQTFDIDNVHIDILRFLFLFLKILIMLNSSMQGMLVIYSIY